MPDPAAPNEAEPALASHAPGPEPSLSHVSETQPGPDPEPTASIWRLSVDESMQRQGVATALMAAAEQWAGRQGFKSLQLITGNATAQTFYRHIGYVEKAYVKPSKYYPPTYFVKVLGE